jgi:hypothetical protein
MLREVTTFCCVQCRLLQPPATACAACGASMVAPVELVRELLHYRDMKMVSGRDWGLITALLAGSSIALPILAPVAVSSIVALVIAKLARSRTLAIAGIELAPPPAVKDARTLYGIARKFRATVSSFVDASPLLVEHVTITTRQGRQRRGPSVLLRRIEHAPFLLDLIEGGTVLVDGAVHVRASLNAHHLWVKRGDALLAKLGVPPDLAIAGPVEINSVAEDGPVIAVTGVVEEEVVPELAFHRDGGQTRVMRGRAGAPIIVEDRRLIGVMPVR